MKFLQELWRKLKGIGLALQPAIFSIIVLIGGFLVLAVVGQGKDTVLALSDGALFPIQIFFSLAAVLWALQTWAWASLVYVLREPQLSPNKYYPKWAATYMPKILGMLALLVTAYALFSMQSAAGNKILLRMGIGFVVLALLFLFFARFPKPEDFFKNDEKKNGKFLFRGFSPAAKTFFMILTAVAVIPLILFIISPQFFTFEGGSAVVVLCISIWIPLGSWLLYLSYRSELPLFTILIILAVIFGYFNDNHHVRVCDRAPVQVTLGDRLDRFLSKYPDAGDETADSKPFYIVATEGGGIRSAYWTALVLGRIQDEKDPAFSDYLFGISSVSGGSLGAAVFDALIKEKIDGRTNSLFDDARNILGVDFLSPTIAMMLTGDLVQQFLPFPVRHLSRGLALERSWEIAYEKNIGNNRFAEPMTSLWQGEGDSHIPSLFLNGTLVESGQRIIAGNIEIGRTFVDALDIFDYTKDKEDMPLSTAAMNSARFPYVSPGGTLAGGIHVVDGGYFDNSGAGTVIEIYFALMKKLRNNPKKLKVIVLMLDNHPKAENVLPPDIEPLTFLPGLLIPIDTLLNVMNSHATYSIDALRKLTWANGGKFVRFQPSQGKVQFPLGWSLSPTVQEKMAEQAIEVVDELWPRVQISDN